MIYALCDRGYLNSHNYILDDFISAIKAINNNHKIAMVQYRDKQATKEQKIKALKYLKTTLNDNFSHNIPLIINDDISLLEYCDGVHLGQDDLTKINPNYDIACKLVTTKTIKQNKLFGLSTHNEQQILQANTMPLSYIGLGAYKATTTKDISQSNILGKRAKYLAKISSHPVAIIGGVSLDDNIPNTTYKCICSGLFTTKEQK